MVSRSLYAFSLSPPLILAFVHPLDALEAHIAFALAAVSALIGLGNLLVSLLRNIRNYRDGF